MLGYFAGIVIGSIVVLLGISFLIYLFIKKGSKKRLIKKLGTKAEVEINKDISIWAKHTNNKFIPSTLFKYGENKVFEVDSILITDKALIVIEIKSIKGKIEGKATDKNWEKVLGTVRHPITNPIFQNDKHIEHIVNMTNNKIPTVSLIVFSNRSSSIDIKDIPLHVVITRHVELFDTLDEINKSLSPVLNEDAKIKIYKAIKSFKARNREDKKLHKNITTGGKKWK